MKSRYPGIRSFETHEASLFFGRQKETAELYNLLKVKRFVVLFAKSGIGKTSLLNAGVIPLLTQDAYYPIKVRFQNTSIAPAQMLLDAVKSHVEAQGRTAKVAETLQFFIGNRKPTLWEYLKACQFEQNDLPAIPLLILDQFEEFFLHSPALQKPFIDGIADILFERVPESVQEEIRAVPRKERSERHLAWATPLHWKIVFAIRADRLSFLDNLSQYIPIILDNRYQLQPLNKEQAQQAVVAPAMLDGDDFQTPKFSYQSSTLTNMLANLSNEQGEVESFQLQILCEYVERQVIARRPAAPISISDDYLSENGNLADGIQDILNSYYEQRISELGNTDAASARRLIEEGLIMNGVRISLPRKVVQDTYGISDALLAKIIDTRIIRAEVSHLGLVYEVSHDTLVGAVLESYERRMAIAEKNRLLAERKRARRAAFIITIIAAIILLALIWAMYQTSVARGEIARNEKLIKGMYFYKDTFALSVIRDKSGKFKYGFMDKQATVRIDYQFEEAQPFDDYGYARVKKEGKLYLIDTKGNFYPLAESLAAITAETKAVSLKEQLLDEIPEIVLSNSNLSVLYLRGNNLKEMPLRINKLNKLIALDVSYNQLPQLPEEIQQLSDLLVLDASNNQLDNMQSIQNMGNLELLNLSNNKITEIPDNISTLKNLQVLDLANNGLEEVNEKAGELANLRQLNLYSNKITKKPAFAGKGDLVVFMEEALIGAVGQQGMNSTESVTDDVHNSQNLGSSTTAANVSTTVGNTQGVGVSTTNNNIVNNGITNNVSTTRNNTQGVGVSVTKANTAEHKKGFLGADCGDIFFNNIRRQNSQDIRTKSILLIARTDFDYSIEFVCDGKELRANIISTDLRPLEQDDKIMFLTEQEERREFKFIYEGVKNTVNGRTCYINSIKLDIADLEWLANNQIKQFRLVDMILKKMYPYSLSPDRQIPFKKTVRCFLDQIDK